MTTCLHLQRGSRTILIASGDRSSHHRTQEKLFTVYDKLTGSLANIVTIILKANATISYMDETYANVIGALQRRLSFRQNCRHGESQHPPVVQLLNAWR
jgi:hypothetical protein